MALLVDGDTTSLAETDREDEEPGMCWVISRQFRYGQLVCGPGNRIDESLSVGQRRDQQVGHWQESVLV